MDYHRRLFLIKALVFYAKERLMVNGTGYLDADCLKIDGLIYSNNTPFVVFFVSKR
jgi:hypothetical protein